MPGSLTHKISLSFILIIFAEGHILNSPFVPIVPFYALVVQHTVRWSRYRFADFTRLKQLSQCILIHMLLYVLTHITAWTQGRPLLPVLRNSSRFLTIPLTSLPYMIFTWDSICHTQFCILKVAWQLFCLIHSVLSFEDSTIISLSNTILSTKDSKCMTMVISVHT